MKLERQEFQEILESVRPGLAVKDIVEQATHFVFTGTELITYNDEVCVVYPLKTEFACSVSAVELYKLIKDIRSDKLLLRFDEKQQQLIIRSGNTKAGLSALMDLSILDMVGIISRPSLNSKKWGKVPEDFLEGVFLCLFSSAKHSMVPYLSCLLVRGACVVSTDDMRISEYVMKGKMSEFLLPSRFAIDLVKYNISHYYLSESWIFFKTSNDVIFCCRVVIDKFPEYSDFFSVEKLKKIKLPAALKKAVDSASVFAEGDFDIDKKIDIIIEGDKIKCRGEKAQGWIEVTSKLDIERKREVRFSINPLFFSQILSKATTMGLGEDRVLFETGAFRHLISLYMDKE